MTARRGATDRGKRLDAETTASAGGDAPPADDPARAEAAIRASGLQQQPDAVLRQEIAAEEAARLGDRRYRELLDNAHDIIYTHDLTRITSINHAAAALTGYTREELLGMPLSRLMAPAQVAYSLGMWRQKANEEAAATTYPLEIIAKNGERIPLEISSWLLYREGKVVGVQGIARDLRERRRVEQELRASEDRFRRLAERAADYIYRFEYLPTPRFAYCSPGVTNLIGYTPEELYADPDLPLKIVLSEDRHLSSPMLSSAKAQPAVTMRVRRKDGRIIWAEFRRTFEYDAAGTLLAVEGVARDVTERKRAEDGQRFLAEAGELLAGSLDERTTLASLARLTVPALADWCSMDLVQPDGALAGLGGCHVDPTKEPLIHELQARYPPAPGGPQPSAHVAATGRPLLLEQVSDAELAATSRDAEHLRLRRALGFRAAIFVPLRARGRMLGMITMVRASADARYDAEDLALAEELARRAALAVDNARLYREAQEAVRERDEFLSVAAHELKTPITSLRGYAQLLLRRADTGRDVDAAALRRAVETIDRQSRTLARLVSQLLDTTRLDAGRLALERAPTDLAALAAHAADAVQATTSAHTITCHAPADPVTANVDALRLEQVLVNLLDNAVKYSPAGGPIRIDVAQPEPGAARIAVTDRGVGVAPEQRSRIFDRFYQARSGGHGGGIGLGLAVSRQIVELHGGTLSHEAPPEGGSRFVVALPAG